LKPKLSRKIAGQEPKPQPPWWQRLPLIRIN
jgi:hypothetical protein